MKAALIISDGAPNRPALAAPFKLLGYTPLVAKSIGAAMHMLRIIKFDVIVIYHPTFPGDRRSIAGEIKRIRRSSIVILATDSDEIYSKARSNHYSGLTAVLREPITYMSIWRVIECVRDGDGVGVGVLPVGVEQSHERRTVPPFSADF